MGKILLLVLSEFCLTIHAEEAPVCHKMISSRVQMPVAYSVDRVRPFLKKFKFKIYLPSAVLKYLA